MNKRALILLSVWLATATSPSMAQQHFQILKGGQSYLGVQIRDITATEVDELELPQEAGVYVMGTNPNSPAAEADLRNGDVIIQFASQPVWSVAQFQRLVSETPVGREVRLAVLREGQTIHRSAIVGKGGRSSGSGIFPAQPAVPGFGPARPDFDFQLEQPPPESRARLGIRGEELTAQMAETLGIPNKQGVLVMEILQDSAAEKGGLRAGDVIIAVDDQPVRALSDIAERLKPGPVEVKVVRDKEVRTLQVDLTPEKPDRPGRLRL